MTYGCVGHHKDLVVWQLAIDLVARIYDATRALPREERFGLISQMRRAAVSIPANIAEGAARGSRADFARFILIARGSLAELETLLIVAERLEFLPTVEDLLHLLTAIRQMLIGLHRSLTER